MGEGLRDLQRYRRIVLKIFDDPRDKEGGELKRFPSMQKLYLPESYTLHAAEHCHSRCDGAPEVAADWYYYLEERLVFPFRARCGAALFPQPAHRGQDFEVIGLATEDACTNDMRVMMRIHGTKVIVPLVLLEVTEAFGETIEAVAQWKSWVRSGPTG